MYDSVMVTAKLSATVDADLLKELRARVGPRGMSAVVNRALLWELDRMNLRELVDELEEKLGPPDEQMVAETRELLDKLAADQRPKPKAKKAKKQRRGSAA